MLSWGSLLIATILDTKDIMGDLSGGDAVSRTGPLYHLDQPMLLSHIHFFPHDLMISVWGFDFFFFFKWHVLLHRNSYYSRGTTAT